MGWSVPLIPMLLKGQLYGTRKTWYTIASSVALSRKCATSPIMQCEKEAGGSLESHGLGAGLSLVTN